MSLDVDIIFKKPRIENYYLNHPYSYNGLTAKDKAAYQEEDSWWANITHNLGEMASNIPVTFRDKATTLYYACWRPEEIGAKIVADVLPMLIQGIHYMIDHRKELMQYESPNGWGTYNGFMKFLLNYKQACEDNDPECEIKANR